MGNEYESGVARLCREVVRQLEEAGKGAEQGDGLDGPVQAARDALLACAAWAREVLARREPASPNEGELAARALATKRIKLSEAAMAKVGLAQIQQHQNLSLTVTGQVDKVESQAAALREARNRSNKDMRGWLMGQCPEVQHQVCSSHISLPSLQSKDLQATARLLPLCRVCTHGAYGTRMGPIP